MWSNRSSSPSRGLLHDCTTSPINRFAALVQGPGAAPRSVLIWGGGARCCTGSSSRPPRGCSPPRGWSPPAWPAQHRGWSHVCRLELLTNLCEDWSFTIRREDPYYFCILTNYIYPSKYWQLPTLYEYLLHNNKTRTYRHFHHIEWKLEPKNFNGLL